MNFISFPGDFKTALILVLVKFLQRWYVSFCRLYQPVRLTGKSLKILLSHIFIIKMVFFILLSKIDTQFFIFPMLQKLCFSFLFVNFDLKLEVQPKNCLCFLILQKIQIQQVPSNTPGAIEALEITSSSNYICKLFIQLPLKAPPIILDVSITTVSCKSIKKWFHINKFKVQPLG